MSHKVCSKCKEQKPFSEFCGNRYAKDGLNYSCKQCQWEYNHSDAGYAARARYAKTEKGKKTRAKALRKFRAKEHGRQLMQEGHRRYRRQNPQKVRARNAVANEVVMKRMPPATTLPCICCKQPAMGYHHYLGYSESHHLDVIPLCRSCDIAAHKAMDQ